LLEFEVLELLPIALEQEARRLIHERQRRHLSLREGGVGANPRINRQAQPPERVPALALSPAGGAEREHDALYHGASLVSL